MAPEGLAGEPAAAPAPHGTRDVRARLAGSRSGQWAGTAPRDELAHNGRLFDRVVGIARARAVAGRQQSALEWCRVAAEFAMTNPVGPLRSSDLEQVVDLVAAAALPPGPWPARGRGPGGGGRRRVVHVLTEGAAIGGLTRGVQRWIERDTETTASVVVTRQPGVVAALEASVLGSGGTAIALGEDGPDSIERAARLRSLVSDADAVVCHLHSDDVVTAAAFGAGYTGPPVAMWNLADHLFWLAPTRLSTLIEARTTGERLSREVRGVPPELSHTLHLPVPRSEVAAAGGVREDLGVRPDEVIAITVARAIKFQDTRLTPRFGDLVDALLEENPGLVFCGVGPRPDDEPWPALRHRHGRRLVLTGPVNDPSPYLAAADIYLDTFPFSSSTSMLEGTAAALPAVTLAAHRGYREALGIADFLVDDADRPTDTAAWLDRVRALVDSPAERRTSGERAREGYLRFTSREQWVARLDDLYTALDLARDSGRVLGDVAAPATSEEATDYALALLAVEQNVPLLWSLSGSMPRLDADDRRAVQPRRFASRVARKARQLAGLPQWPADDLLLTGLAGR